MVGQSAGDATITLSTAQIPSHSHALVADKEVATSSSPSGAIYMKGHYTSPSVNGQVQTYTAQAPNTNMSANAIGPAGGNLPHNNLMPYLTLNFCIALQGIFPPRS